MADPLRDFVRDITRTPPVVERAMRIARPVIDRAKSMVDDVRRRLAPAPEATRKPTRTVTRPAGRR